MKLRRLPTDFCVEEENSLPIERTGDFAVYCLRKTSWNTLDALKHVAIHWKFSANSFSHAGLKDRHAVSSQVITIRNGPQRNYESDQISLEYMGQSSRATDSADIVGNHFTLVLRSLSAAERQSAEQAIPEITNAGIANYFDDQRFGSYFPGKPFIAEHWIRGEYEKALWLAFVEPYPGDDQSECEQKAILKENWGDWALCKEKLSRSHRRSIVTFLDDRKDDFKGAWARVNADMRGMYLTALQSDLWNRILKKYLQETCSQDQLIDYSLKTGTVCIPTSLTESQREELHSLLIPLPSARLKLAESPLLKLMEGVLAEAGWKLDELKVRTPRDRYFPKASRAAMIGVDGLEAEFSDDELSEGLSKLTVSFSLPRGCYATMVVKRLMLWADQ